MRDERVPRGPGHLRLRRPAARCRCSGPTCSATGSTRRRPGSTPGRRRSRPGACREEHWNDKSAVSDAEGRGPRLFFQKVPEPKTTKNRLHLDVRAAPGTEGAEREAALNAEADRLVALGARVVEPFHVDPMGAAFIVMSDPEGNEFCLD